MAMLQGGPINTGEHTRSMPEGTPLPPGIYTGVIVKTAQRETQGKNGNSGGVMVEVEFDITSPEEFANSGRKVWDRFNIVNASAEAVRISKENLADLGLAAGYEVLEDDEQLMGQEVMMRLVVEPAKPYKDRQGVDQLGKPTNKCLKYFPMGTNVDEYESAAKASRGAATSEQPKAAQKTGWQKPAAAGSSAPASSARPAPAVAAQASQAASAPATNQAPWKRNKQ